MRTLKELYECIVTEAENGIEKFIEPLDGRTNLSLYYVSTEIFEFAVKNKLFDGSKTWAKCYKDVEDDIGDDQRDHYYENFAWDKFINTKNGKAFNNELTSFITTFLNDLFKKSPNGMFKKSITSKKSINNTVSEILMDISNDEYEDIGYSLP